MCVPQVFAELGHFTAVHFRHVRHSHAKLSASYGIYQLSVIALVSCCCVHNVNDIKLSLLALLFCFVWPAEPHKYLAVIFLSFRPRSGLHVIECWNCRFILLNQFSMQNATCVWYQSVHSPLVGCGTKSEMRCLFSEQNKRYLYAVQ